MTNFDVLRPRLVADVAVHVVMLVALLARRSCGLSRLPQIVIDYIGVKAR
jgi:hypothetical protein